MYSPVHSLPLCFIYIQINKQLLIITSNMSSSNVIMRLIYLNMIIEVTTKITYIAYIIIKYIK